MRDMHHLGSLLETTLAVSRRFDRPAADVRRYMTTPDHWPLVLEATQEIRGERTDQPCPVGTSFVDVIKVAPGVTVDVEWTVRLDEPGHWEITASSPVSHDPTHGTLELTLTYTFTAAEPTTVEPGVLVTRTVHAHHAGDAPVPLPYRDVCTDSAAAAGLLAAFAAVLEAESAPGYARATAP
jgi:hypothetical protein